MNKRFETFVQLLLVFFFLASHTATVPHINVTSSSPFLTLKHVTAIVIGLVLRQCFYGHDFAQGYLHRTLCKKKYLKLTWANLYNYFHDGMQDL